MRCVEEIIIIHNQFILPPSSHSMPNYLWLIRNGFPIINPTPDIHTYGPYIFWQDDLKCVCVSVSACNRHVDRSRVLALVFGRNESHSLPSPTPLPHSLPRSLPPPPQTAPAPQTRPSLQHVSCVLITPVWLHFSQDVPDKKPSRPQFRTPLYGNTRLDPYNTINTIHGSNFAQSPTRSTRTSRTK